MRPTRLRAKGASRCGPQSIQECPRPACSAERNRRRPSCRSRLQILVTVWTNCFNAGFGSHYSPPKPPLPEPVLAFSLQMPFPAHIEGEFPWNRRQIAARRLPFGFRKPIFRKPNKESLKLVTLYSVPVLICKRRPWFENCAGGS